MPQLQNLILKDRETTPVDHTFVPNGISGENVGEVIESNGVPFGNRRVTIQMKKLASGRYQANLRMIFPVLVTETINGIQRDTVLRTSYADLKFTFDGNSTLKERDNMVGMLQSALAADQPLIHDTIVKLTTVY